MKITSMVSRVTVVGVLMAIVSTAALAAESAREAGYAYKFYYGTLHTQTSFSDGGWPNTSTCTSNTDPPGGGRVDPAGAYTYAKNTAGLDFLGISDHNHYWSTTFTGAQVISNYHTGLNAAAAYINDPAFVAIYGMEWGYNSSEAFPGEGHINLFETTRLLGWSQGSDFANAYEVCTDPAYYVNHASSTYCPSGTGAYTQALANANPSWPAIGSFCHPADLDFGTGVFIGDDFESFSYTTDGDDLMHLIAVISGPYNGFTTDNSATGGRHAGPAADAPGGVYSPYTNKDMYNTALAAGFHVAPVADSDVHCSNYGNSAGDRTVVVIPSGTPYSKAAWFDAVHHRRVYATSDRSIQLVFNITSGSTTYQMGSGGIRSGPDSGRVQTSGTLSFHVSALNSTSSPMASIQIKEVQPSDQTNGTATIVASTTNASVFNTTLTPTPGNHTYYVYVKNNAAQLWSAPIWITQSGGTPPAAPTGLTATPGNTQVTLSWTASTGATSYNVKRATVSGGPYTTISTAGSVTGTTYTDTGLTNGTTYYYVVSAVNANGESANSAQASATPTAGSSPPAAPTGLTATAGFAQVSLSWTASTGATSYNVKRSTVNGGPYTTISSAGSVTGTTYTDTGLTNGTTYYYVVSAVNSVGESANSAQVSATPADTTAPTAPTNLAVTAGTTGTLNLSWTASTDPDNASSTLVYQVFRRTGRKGSFTQIATTAAGVTSYSNSGLTSGTTYQYYVNAKDPAGNVSAASSTVSATAP